MAINKKPIQLDGQLNLELDDHPIQVRCEGQSIRLIFASFSGLKKFIKFNRTYKLDQRWVSSFTFTYFINDHFIGESGSYLADNWIGRYVGLNKTKIYPRAIWNSLFS